MPFIPHLINPDVTFYSFFANYILYIRINDVPYENIYRLRGISNSVDWTCHARCHHLCFHSGSINISSIWVFDYPCCCRCLDHHCVCSWYNRSQKTKGNPYFNIPDFDHDFLWLFSDDWCICNNHPQKHI